MREPTMLHRLAAEFIGTFWLVFGGCGSAVFAAYVMKSPPIYESLRERMPDEASIEGRGRG